MGEYATRTSDGERVKIGTCEDMYYLRADQRQLVTWERGNVDPNSDDAYALRFRFPFPNEDGTLPGEFEDYRKSVAVYGFAVPNGVEHYSVQFRADAGYVTGIPCPEGSDQRHGLTIHRNGFSGAVKLVQQKLLRDGRLVPVCQCGGCGAAWRIEEPAEIEALAVAFRAEGDGRIQQSRDKNPCEGAFWHTIADRILEGAKLTADVEG